MGLRGKSPGGPYIFYGGEPTRGTPGPPRIFLERAKGIEPSYSAWKADVLPLNYARRNYNNVTSPRRAVKGILRYSTTMVTPLLARSRSASRRSSSQRRKARRVASSKMEKRSPGITSRTRAARALAFQVCAHLHADATAHAVRAVAVDELERARAGGFGVLDGPGGAAHGEVRRGQVVFEVDFLEERHAQASRMAPQGQSWAQTPQPAQSAPSMAGGRVFLMAGQPRRVQAPQRRQ